MLKTVLASCGALLLGPLALAACGADAPSKPNQQGSMNTASGGSASSVAGSAAVGGSNVGTGGFNVGSGGKVEASSQGGSSGSAAVSGNTGGARSDSSGGSSNASGGTAGSAPSGGKVAPDPSNGCGKANPKVGSSGSPLTVSGHQYYVKLPTNYDASKPYPVLMMFNPTGNPIEWAEGNARFEGTGPKEAWIRVYPTMANNGNGWGASDVSFFAPFYEQVLASYCVDKARVF